MPKHKSHSTSRCRRCKIANSRIHEAVIFGKQKDIKDIHESGEDINQLNMEWNTPLHLAVIHNKPRVVKTLLDLGANISILDKSKSSPLHTAVTLGRNNIVKIIMHVVEHKIIRDSQGRTAIHLAAIQDNMNMLKSLIEFGEDVNELDKYLTTPLHLAVTHGSVGTVKLLLEYGANPDNYDHVGTTPVHLAAHEGKDNVLKVLIQHGGSISKVNGRWYTPLHVAAINNKCAVIRTLVLSGANINAPTKCFDTPLHFAADFNNFKAAETLIHLGARVDHRNIAGKTPLHLALLQDDMKLVDILIKNTKYFDYYDCLGCSPLEIAILYCKPKVLEKLILSGAVIKEESSFVTQSTHRTSHSYIASRYCEKDFIDEFKKLKCYSDGEETPVDSSVYTSLNRKDKQLMQRLLEYNVSLSDLLETVQKFIKYEILFLGENSTMYQRWLSESDEIYPSLLPYLEICYKEVSCMSDKFIHEGITFYQFTKRGTSELLLQSSVAKDYINHILDIRCTNAYPIYRNFIAARIQKGFLKQELLNFSFYTRVNSSRKIFLDVDSVSSLCDYLSNLDILNLALAVSDQKQFLK